MSSRATLSIYQGDDYVADAVVTAPDGTPADLTGYQASAHIRRTGTDPDGVAQFACTIAGNVVSMVLGHDQTATLAHNSYVWDLEVVGPGGWVTTILYGQVLVTRGVTMAAGAAR